MPKRPTYDPANDEPKVGDIWKCNEILNVVGGGDVTWGWIHYLLLDRDDFSSSRTFTMLCLNTGEHHYRYMNFELDDWRFHA